VATELRVFAVPGLPDLAIGADLATLIADAVSRAGLWIETGDVVVVAQKIVSKAEGAVVRLDEVTPSNRASAWAAEHGKDARLVEVVLRESTRIVRMERGVLIAETRHGFVCANAGVDSSNVEQGFVTVLPRDPDASASRLRAGLRSAVRTKPNTARSSVKTHAADVAVESDAAGDLAVIISDTFGRPWREGVVNVALGVAGLRPLVDYRGCRDPYGRELTSTVMAVADEIASAAELVMGKTARRPVAIVRGAAEWLGVGTGADLLRDSSRDLFR
jgi:coenzyme F420-0:L-glutamate ligase / coenzyme F420-1:gamma-L-glutamate ligase